MRDRITLWWLAALLVAGNFVTARVLIPGLINLHNDGALVGAFLLAGVILTVDYLFIKNLRPLMVRDNTEE